MLHLYFSRYPLDLLPPWTHLETLSSPWRGHGTCPWHSRCSASPHRRHPGWRWPRHTPRHLGDTEVTEKIWGLWHFKNVFLTKHFKISGPWQWKIPHWDHWVFMKIFQWFHWNGLNGHVILPSDGWGMACPPWRTRRTSLRPAVRCDDMASVFVTRKRHRKVFPGGTKMCPTFPGFQLLNSLFGGYYSVLLKLSFQYIILR